MPAGADPPGNGWNEMKFSYGKRDFSTFERGEENSYLMTNGLGGFSSLSLIASCSRSDQAVLMACIQPPNHRVLLIHRLEEQVWTGEKKLPLSSQDFAPPGKREEGYLHQIRFTYEDYPQWIYQLDGVQIERTMALMQGRNTVGVRYRICNRQKQAVRLEVLPYLQFVPKGERLSPNQSFAVFAEQKGGICTGRICSGGIQLHFRTNGSWEALPGRFCETLRYADDERDGKMELGRSYVNHRMTYEVEAGRTKVLEIVWGMEEELPEMETILDSDRSFRKGWAERAGEYAGEAHKALILAASQFISARQSTGKSTILAGFPFFEDWGRDTMIALTGCCLSTKQYALAAEILETFMVYCRKGLMPNLFPEGGTKPVYNTADASLLFILAVYEYYRRTCDLEFVKRAWPVMKEIVSCYQNGTDYGIRMDEDGLLRAGQGCDQVTWMDVRVENRLPTPRHGKPVEINAYWYNALRMMDGFQTLLGEQGGRYSQLAARVFENFEKKFWNEQTGCLRDVLPLPEEIPAENGQRAQDQIRCNQIWAVSLPFSLLSEQKERQVVETVYQRLYTPFGLRSLDPADPDFHPFYGGSRLDRDLAYHQGTVWVFPLGGYYLAYLKCHRYSKEAKEQVKEQLSWLETALWEGCVGQLPEIYDGENPSASRGCFAQAWSVGEILRVYEALEQDGRKS